MPYCPVTESVNRTLMVTLHRPFSGLFKTVFGLILPYSYTELLRKVHFQSMPNCPVTESVNHTLPEGLTEFGLCLLSASRAPLTAGLLEAFSCSE
jgi:uncharacterized protein YlaN (UPF0358 family)